MKENFHQYIEKLPPTILTIFGATGDLSLDYLLPALSHMIEEGIFPPNFRLVAVSRRPWTTDEYLSFLKQEFKARNRVVSEKLLSAISYFAGDFDHKSSFNALAGVLGDKDIQAHSCFNRLFYFATDPKYFEFLSHVLKDAGLLKSCAKHNRMVRVLVEKPFGSNEQTAKKLNKLLLTYFKEQQIYRIDHFLGKEVVQNLLVMRFANDFLEPVWNREHIDHIEVSVLESELVGKRVNFYDKTGAIKDMLQNHILHMLALTLMDRPQKLAPEEIAKQKLKILRSLQLFTAAKAKTDLVIGQYSDYRSSGGLKSETETFAALKVTSSHPRWKGVPFFLRTGKGLARKVAEISIHFKQQKNKPKEFLTAAPNVLTFQIQPDESVRMQISNKTVGFGVELHTADLVFGYKEAFKHEIPAAYERLLLDFIQGDQRLFLASGEVEAAWRFVDSIIPYLENATLERYLPGCNGPKAADKLVSKYGGWWTK
ncbi:MAG TPA: glucose-6-phosphate dehydrogenase [Patescibacteria group bacterium]|nr:glucose-6-phosphate dehydrogenase [Patescibacteria group bacterium]